MKKNITFSLPEEFLRLVDEEAKKRHMTRSEFIKTCVANQIEKENKKNG